MYFYSPKMDCRYAHECLKHDPEKCIERHRGAQDRPPCFQPKTKIMEFHEFKTYLPSKRIIKE
ncbi:MAG: hypothetical protein QXJ68_00665 [Methanocellales archaeon]